MTRRRSVPRSLFCALFLAFALATAPAARAEAPAQGSVTLTLPQARAAIRAAAARGDTRIVRLLSQGLAAGGEADGQVYFLWAEAEAAEGNAPAALEAATQAYRRGETDRQRFQAAQLAARAALEAGQPTTAQVWLRRTYQHTGDADARAAIAEDYRTLRAINPLTFRLNFGVSPSSNLNNGADSEWNVIDGVPVVGLLSPTAQALSGVEYSADVVLGYRLGPLRRDRRVTAVARLYSRHVRLSEEARALAPDARNADFAYTVLQGGLRLQGALAEGQRYGAGLHTGQSWYGGARYFHFARVEADWSTALSDAARLGVSGMAERRFYDHVSLEETLAQAGLSLTHALPGGDLIRAQLALRAIDATGITRDSRGVTLGLEWSPERAFGPVSLTLGLNAAYTDYPDYQVGFIAVPGGRRDRTIGAEATVTFDRIDYAGFVPTLDLGVRRTRSNVSRFDTEEFTFGLGIRSAF